jgi:hypothetical protein
MWTSESWLATVDRMKLLQQTAEENLGTLRGAPAALARVVRECEAGCEQARARGGVHKAKSAQLARSELCARFNEAAAPFCHAPESTAPCPPALVTHVLEAAYDVAVTNPRQLNKYKPFSREVYGETNASLVQHIVETQKITDADTFFDLGSGIGQVVLQAAAMTGCRAFGVELMDTPAQYAAALQVAFGAEYVSLLSCSQCIELIFVNITDYVCVHARLRRWGKALKHQPTLIHGDMFAEADLAQATAIFVNNFAFPVELNQTLGAHIESQCAVGTKILTYKPITPMGRRRRTRPDKNATPHHATTGQSDGSGLREVGRGIFEHDGVSWTSGPIEYITYELC